LSSSILSITIYLFIFLVCLPGITGYHRVSPGITRPGFFSPAGLRRTSLRGRGDVPRLAVPPIHDYRSLNSGTVYPVLQRLTPISLPSRFIPLDKY